MLVLLSLILECNAARIKDIASIEGTTGVQVIGYGLVSGLGQAGDSPQSSITTQSVTNMLKRFGITVPLTNPKIRNVAAVMVTATLPTFSRKGSKIDVQVSSIGDAKTLQGGLLLMTPLSTANGSIMGMAQGAVSVGGYEYEANGSQVSRNFVTTGRVPNGMVLENNIEGQYLQNQLLVIALRDPDFTTSSRIATAINTSPGLTNAATAVDAATIRVQLPAGIDQNQSMQYISQIESLNVTADPTARVVVNERTGTVVVGGNVQLLPAVVAQGGLEISIQKQVVVSQPAPFTIAPPITTETAKINTQEETNQSVPLTVQGPTVQDIANALNLLKVKPRDLIAIFQALKDAGSLQGELIIQ
jgi:flagellar P-ring protein precursor FlgI